MDRRSCLISIWLRLELFAMAVFLTKGEIRCYCDSPQCVATGYMCKSELNACFTKALDLQNRNSPSAHGCVSPALNLAGLCSSGPANDVFGGHGMLCCHDDMCNYRGLHNLAQNGAEYSGNDGKFHPESRGNIITRVQERVSSREAWFRAAVIAVPIVGGLILALLVVLAVHMLRAESRRLRDRRHQTLCRLHHTFHGFYCKKGHHARPDLGRPVPTLGLENGCLSWDRAPQAGPSGNRVLSLVH